MTHITISVKEELLYKAMEAAEKRTCNEWFGNSEEYENWAGDRVTDTLWNFITALAEKCHIEITTEA